MLKGSENLRNFRNLLEEKRALERKIVECRSKIVLVDTIIIFERPTTEEKLRKLIERIPKKYPWLDLRLYDFSLHDTDIYLIGEKKKIFSCLKEIAEKIEKGVECRMENVGISFSPPGKFSLEDLLSP